ncbi:ribosome biogenesis GTPase A [Fistulifera solaris]|uniref:Ribosome biogenesis GTPase A n=1 Tax=Fistulifera solaris TaxID=1519565 RepID=A0A1Z5KNC4_FISSO|nr:ribosome biogenesis GTPase A [Fistulifera solaris]|eukprot:GAX27615.1 ribosome biogenesis GTPase A [Fistulifera solaris]
MICAVFLSLPRCCRSFQRISPLLCRQYTRSVDLSAQYSPDNDEAGYARPVVQWYPGHIAKAERQLQETFKAVDVVVEVRDARAAKATAHPSVAKWSAGKPRMVVWTHGDQIPASSRKAWQQAYLKLGDVTSQSIMDKQIQHQAVQARKERQKYTIKNSNNNKEDDIYMAMFVNGKTGEGIHGLVRAILKAGAHVQERRERRGLKPRALRVGVIGFPNVGKSALINRLLGKRRAKTANTPGVTRALQWIRVSSTETISSNKGDSFELLDSPGVIPATLPDQSDAQLLAACNCIGTAAYDNQAIAAYLCTWLMALYQQYPEAAPEWRDICRKRYKFDPLTVGTGEDMLWAVADNTCQGNPEDAARKILQDFRAGRWGLVCLQVAPVSAEEPGQRPVMLEDRTVTIERDDDDEEKEEESKERARVALQTMEEWGLELPPAVVKDDEPENATEPSSIGKGMFEGW